MQDKSALTAVAPSTAQIGSRTTASIPDVNAMELLAIRRRIYCSEGRKDPENVLSPCISVCRMSTDRSHCEGCFRTLDELKAWSKAGVAQKNAIWAALIIRAGLDPVADAVAL